MINTAPIPESQARAAIEATGLRATAPRLAIYRLLFSPPQPRHFDAAELIYALEREGRQVATATVYNTLDCFVQLGLLRRTQVEVGRVVYDTEQRPHAHLMIDGRHELVNLYEMDLINDFVAQHVPDASRYEVDAVIRLTPKRRSES